MFLLLLCPVANSQAQSWPTPEQIVEEAVLRAERQTVLEAELQFESVYVMVEDSLDASGQTVDTETLTYRRYPLEGAMFDEVIAKNGRPLDANEAEREHERREEFIEDVRRRRANDLDPQPEEESRVDFNREFVSRYRFSHAGEDIVGTHSCWVLSFEPKGGDLPVRRRMDHALNNATGKIWINQTDWGLARVEFEMSRSVKFWGGILGTLRNTVGRLEFDRIDEGVWLLTDLNIRLDLRILFRNIRRRVTLDWDRYERRTGGAVAQGPARQQLAPGIEGGG